MLSPTPPETDLAALIGEVRREASRRRSDPSHPLAEEGALDAEMAQWAPAGAPGALRRLARRAGEAAVPATPSSDPGGGPLDAPGVARLLSAALHECADRLADLDSRLLRVERGWSGGVADPGVESTPSTPRPSSASLPPQMREAAPGRVLLLAEDPGPLVADLRGRGVDAYGIAVGGDESVADLDVAPGTVLGHLAALADGSLRGVVLVDPVFAVAGPDPQRVADQLRRVSGMAVVLGESPWWWREHRGPAGELAPRRPVSPELWLEAFHRDGLRVEAAYDDDGRRYRVVAHS